MHDISCLVHDSVS